MIGMSLYDFLKELDRKISMFFVEHDAKIAYLLVCICNIAIYLVFGFKYWCGIMGVIVLHTLFNT